MQTHIICCSKIFNVIRTIINQQLYYSKAQYRAIYYSQKHVRKKTFSEDICKSTFYIHKKAAKVEKNPILKTVQKIDIPLTANYVIQQQVRSLLAGVHVPEMYIFGGFAALKSFVICVTFLRIVSRRQMEWNDKITKKLITRRDFSSYL